MQVADNGCSNNFAEVYDALNAIDLGATQDKNQNIEKKPMPTGTDRMDGNTGKVVASGVGRKAVKMLHSDPHVDRLIRAAQRENVATEMLTILGFMLEQSPLTSVYKADLTEYRHNYGLPFACLRIFRDWCCVTPKKRAGWCQSRGFSNEVLETVCNFVTDVMTKLHSDVAVERTLFRRDTKAAEKCVVQLFLEDFSDGLAVYSGSHHVGYVRLSDKQKIRPQDVKSFITPPKHALFFKIKGCCSLGKSKTSPVRKCMLYLPGDIVMEHMKKSENPEFIKRRIDSFFERVRVSKIQNVCPAVMTKAFSDSDKIQEFIKNVKDTVTVSVHDLFIDADFDENSLTIHTWQENKKENLIFDQVKKLVDQEKDVMINEVAHFEYPNPGSGMTLRLLNNCKVDDILERCGRSCPDSSSTILIYVCCAVPESLGIGERLDKYGEVVRIMSDEEAKMGKPEPRLWGKIHCETDEQRKILLNDMNGSWSLSHHVNLKWARPDLRTDATSVEYLRVSVRAVATPVKQVTMFMNSNSWKPAKKFVVVGKDPCKIFWLKNGDGVFKPNREYVSNQKIFGAVKESFGNDIRVHIDRGSEETSHNCFKREKDIVDSFIGIVPHIRVPYHITLNEISRDNEYHTDFVDIFEDGKKFLEEYEKAKENKSLAKRRNKHMWIHAVEHVSAMLVKREVFECIKCGLEVVCQTVAKNRLNVSVDASSTKSNMMLIQVHGKSEAEVKRVSTVVKKVISPEIIKSRDEKNPEKRYLLPYLTSCGGKKLIDKIEIALSVKFLLQPNGDHFYIYGPPECRKEAKQRILSHTDKLAEPINIALPNDDLKVSLLKHVMKLYGRDLNELCRQTGADSLSWNSKQDHFTIWGNLRCVEACRKKIMSAYDLVKSSAVTDNHRPSCVACFCPIEGFPFRLSLCGHMYCESCINVHVTVAIRDRSLPIHCVAEGCREIVVLNDIGRSCNYSEKGLRSLLDAAVSLFVAQTGESCPVRHCLTPDCPGLFLVAKNKYEGRQINCGTCGASVCNSCFTSPYHKGYTCALWKCKEHLDEETAQWFSENATLRKMCPRCGIGIEKVEGCSNVYCTNCKASVCYECMEHFDDSSLCYTHLDDVHGGYY